MTESLNIADCRKTYGDVIRGRCDNCKSFDDHISQYSARIRSATPLFTYLQSACRKLADSVAQAIMELYRDAGFDKDPNVLLVAHKVMRSAILAGTSSAVFGKLAQEVARSVQRSAYAPGTGSILTHMPQHIEQRAIGIAQRVSRSLSKAPPNLQMAVVENSLLEDAERTLGGSIAFAIGLAEGAKAAGVGKGNVADNFHKLREEQLIYGPVLVAGIIWGAGEEVYNILDSMAGIVIATNKAQVSLLISTISEDERKSIAQEIQETINRLNEKTDILIDLIIELLNSENAAREIGFRVGKLIELILKQLNTSDMFDFSLKLGRMLGPFILEALVAAYLIPAYVILAKYFNKMWDLIDFLKKRIAILSKKNPKIGDLDAKIKTSIHDPRAPDAGKRRKRRSFTPEELDEIVRHTPDIKEIRKVAKGLDNATAGSLFERWLNHHIFRPMLKTNKTRLTVHVKDNPHLKGLWKDPRSSDVYLPGDGSVWDAKAHRSRADVSANQIDDYRKMEEAGFVNIREGGKLRKVKVKEVNYVFMNESAAIRNKRLVQVQGGLEVWYINNDGILTHLN